MGLDHWNPNSWMPPDFYMYLGGLCGRAHWPENLFEGFKSSPGGLSQVWILTVRIDWPSALKQRLKLAEGKVHRATLGGG